MDDGWEKVVEKEVLEWVANIVGLKSVEKSGGGEKTDGTAEKSWLYSGQERGLGWLDDEGCGVGSCNVGEVWRGLVEGEKLVVEGCDKSLVMTLSPTLQVSLMGSLEDGAAS